MRVLLCDGVAVECVVMHGVCVFCSGDGGDECVDESVVIHMVVDAGLVCVVALVLEVMSQIGLVSPVACR